MTDVSGLFLAVLISDCLTGLLLKPALILTKSLTRDPYNRGFLKKRKSVNLSLYTLTTFILDDKMVVMDGETVAIYDQAQKKWRKRQTKMNVRRWDHATALVRGVDIGKEAI